MTYCLILKIGAAQSCALRPVGIDPVGASTCAAWSAGRRYGNPSLMTHPVGGGAVECAVPGRADGATDRVDRVDWLDGAEV